MAKKQTKYNMAGQIGTMAASNPKNSKVVYSPEDSKKSIAKQAAASTAKAKWDALINGHKIGSSVFPNVGIAPTKVKNSSSANVSGLNNNYDVSDYTKSLIGSGGTGGSGGYYTLDISGMLKAYEQQAQADRDVAKSTYDSKRSDLLTSLKRFQEQNAKDVERTQRAYLSDQASLESSIAQADRQNRINAASRGLGGSGLQQLAQLQNLLSQGQTISDMATENQNTLGNLRTSLANYEEDTNKSLKDILDAYNNTLTNINAQLATNKANAEVQRANSYIPYSPGSGGITAAEAASYGNDLAGQLSTIVRAYQTAKKGTNNVTTYAQSLDALDSLGIPQNSSLYQQAKNNLISIYKSKHKGKAPKY